MTFQEECMKMSAEAHQTVTDIPSRWHKMLRPLAGLHAKLDLIWHFFSNINILFWYENSPAAIVGSMTPEMEEAAFIFSWLSTCSADWNGLAIVYKFFLKWSFIVNQPFIALASQATLLLAWSSCVHCVPCTNCQSNESQFKSVLFTTCLAYLHMFVRNVLWLSISVHFQRLLFFRFFPVCHFLYSQFCSARLYGVSPPSPVLFVFLQKLKSNFTVACHIFLCPDRANWVRSSQGCWCVSELRQWSDLLLDGLICCSHSEVLVA